MKIILTLLVLIFSCSHGFAVTEESLEAALDAAILPFYTSQLQSGVFEGKHGVPISYVKLEVPGEKGALVISGGRTDSHIKYAELVYDLRQAGFSIYLLDHRGQGFSGRMLDDPHKGHVERFEDYVTDLKTFVDTVVNARNHPARFILAHSMGATIAVIYAAKHPDDFDGLILSAPMLQLNTRVVPEVVALFLANGVTVLGMGNAYVPGGAKYDPFAPFEGNDLTHSQIRFAIRRELISRHPQIVLRGPTNRWLRESLKAARQARDTAVKIEMPVLLFQAEMDTAVRPRAQDEFCRRTKDCTREALAGAGHEILLERDEVRDKALAYILGFLNKHTSPN